MRTLFTFIAVFLVASTAFAQTDAEIVANWQLPIDGWFAGPEMPADDYVRKQAEAIPVTDFDAASADFDAAWSSVSGDGNILGASAENIKGGMPASDKGGDDFKDAAFKVLYDESSMYILVQFTDDDVTGEEYIEMGLAPYFKLDAEDVEAYPTAWYTRWSQFGANKLTFKNAGFSAAMMVNFTPEGVGQINWGGTNDVLSNNLFLDDHTTTGSKTVKWIITIGYPVLTGEYRPEFNTEIWKSLSDGKGISFDMKVIDVDADDEFNESDPPAQTPAHYWWNATDDNAWWSNLYCGFLAAKDDNSTGGLADDAIVQNWQLPIDGWFAGPEMPADDYVRKQAEALSVSDFDAASADFDAAWSSISGDGNILGASTENIKGGLPASHKGGDDLKDAAFKVLYDESSMYILLQYTDDDVTGDEYIEMGLAPYFKLDATDVDAYSTAWYTRWSQFGANKLTFNSAGFSAAMMVNFTEEGVGQINWGGTTDVLSNNLYLDDHSEAGSKTVKWIITIGYPVLTGEYRPEFNPEIWKSISDGKGISFDMKVIDVDADDEFNESDPPAQTPAHYWWNATDDNAWWSNLYCGFIKAGSGKVGVADMISEESIFAKITNREIILKETADVRIYNMLGKEVAKMADVDQIDFSQFNAGIYIVRANNEVKKFSLIKR